MPNRSLILTALLSCAVFATIGIALVESWRLRSADAALLTDTYSIASSTRFVSTNSDFMSWTPGTAAASSTKFTISFWFKRAGMSGSRQWIYSTAGNQDAFGFDTVNVEKFQTRIGGADQYWGGVHRDPTAWIHTVIVVDVKEVDPDDRVKVYFNGEQATSTGGSAPATSATIYLIQSGRAQNIGRDIANAAYYFNGYLADFIIVDGQELTPLQFGTKDSSGVWRPVPYNGDVGTNGFKLSFNNQFQLGLDSSGRGNNFATSTNISTTSQMADTPTNNFATWNPVDLLAGSGNTLSAGNLGFTSGGSNYAQNLSTLGVPSGKWYVEFKITALGMLPGFNLGAGAKDGLGGFHNSYTYSACASGSYANGEALPPGTATGTTYTALNVGDVLGMALDPTNGKAWFSVNGVWQNSGDPAAGTGEIFSGVSAAAPWFVSIQRCAGTGSGVVNFGQGGQADLSYYSAAGGYFKYAPPSGFKAIRVSSLPAPAISNPKEYFDAELYIGTSTSQTIGDFLFSPSLVWLKATSTTADNGLFDAIRGAGNVLISNKTNAEAASSTAFSAFTSNGFTLGAYGAFNNPQTSSTGVAAAPNGRHVAWAWKESSSAGFDIVTYTGDNTANRTISHSLGVAPDFVIVKRRDSTGSWYVWSSSMGSSSAFAMLDSNAATSTSNSPWCTTCSASNWNASNFMVTNNATNNLNASAGTYVAYLFAGKSGFSSAGFYRGNNNADGPFIYTDFKPRYIMVKRGDSTGDWLIWDRLRDPYNPAVASSTANTSSFSSNNSTALDFLVNGFKLRAATAGLNTTGNYLYFAFAELPLALTSGPSPYSGTTITRNTNFKKSLYVAGAVAKGSGTFVIDHPLDPRNELLYHSFVESPDMKNVYDGTAVLDGNGEAVIELPEYFLKLNKDFRYLATPIGEPMPDLHLTKEAGKRYFFGLFGPPAIRISGGVAGGKVSWQVTGVRQDPIAKKNPVIVEVDKSQTDFAKKGEYLHPEAYE